MQSCLENSLFNEGIKGSSKELIFDFINIMVEPKKS